MDVRNPDVKCVDKGHTISGVGELQYLEHAKLGEQPWLRHQCAGMHTLPQLCPAQ